MTDEERIKLFVRNVIRLENISRDVAAKVTPKLQEVFRGLIQQLQSLPEGSVERQMAYKRMEGMMRNIFKLPTVTLQSELIQALEDEAPHQVAYSQKYMQLSDDKVFIFDEAAGGWRPLQTVNLTLGAKEASAFRIAQAEAVAKTRVLQKPIESLTPDWGNSMRRNFEKLVNQGFIDGLSTPELTQVAMKAYKKGKREMKAIVRTALFEMSQQALFEVADANPEEIAYWKFDATMDPDVCHLCAFLNGKRRDNRSDFPYPYDAENGEFGTRVHPNCRCQIIPITNAVAEREEKDPTPRNIVELVPAKDLPKRKGETDRQFLQRMRDERLRLAEKGELPPTRWYMQPEYKFGPKYKKVTGKPKGKQKFYRKVTTLNPVDGKEVTMGQFLQRANFNTRRSVLRSKERAERFGALIKGTEGSRSVLTPDEALAKVTAEFFPDD